MTLSLQQLYSQGQDALRVVLRDMAKDDLWLFLTEVLYHPDIDCDEGECCKSKRGFYEPLHKAWCDWASDETKPRKLLLAPRGHFKSTVVSYASAVHSIIRRPNIRILLVSALAENAENFCKQVKAAFQYNPRLAWLFPEFHVPPDRQFGPQHSFITPARTNHNIAAPTFTAAYIDASLASQHYDKIIMDDPIEAKHVATEEQAAKARGSYNKIIPLLDPPTEGNYTDLLVVGTRWAYFDLYSNHIPVEQGGTAEKTTYDCIVRACFEKDGKPDFDAGDPIFPTRFTRSTLMNLLDEYRNDDRMGEQFWWNQHMNMCRAPDMAPFVDEWFIEVDSQSLPPLFSKMIVVDTALKDDTIAKKGSRGDYTVILVGGWDREGRLYVIDGLRSNILTSKLFTDALVSFAQKYSIPTVVRQKVGEDTVGTQIKDAFYSARAPIDYRPIGLAGMGRKVQRIKDALQAPMQRGDVMWVKRLFPNGIVEHHRLLEQAKKELLNLGQYPVDDVADCMANFYHPDIKFAKANLVGVQNNWKVPISPIIQQSSDPSVTKRYQSFGGRRDMRSRRGAGWAD